MSTISVPMIEEECISSFTTYGHSDTVMPLFICGDAIDVLKNFPTSSIDFVMTSPPYWGQRQYDNGGIGLENDCHEYINNLVRILTELHRVMKPTGSLWLNIGDTYYNKCLMGIPWRVAFRMTDEIGWTLRNDVIWNKVKGGLDNSKDRLRNIHEYIFHFVKDPKDYYYEVDAIRSTPRKTKIVNGSVISATGVSGVRYKRHIELSTALQDAEKISALSALDEVLSEVTRGIISDFRMIIRGQQRTTHSDSSIVSGRAKELQQKGFYFLKYHPNGSKPSDIWEIIPEDTQSRKDHFAPYPADLCRIPLLATCPPNGIALDPFCGTGTTMFVAQSLSRKSIGIDISPVYVESARERCRVLL